MNCGATEKERFKGFTPFVETSPLLSCNQPQGVTEYVARMLATYGDQTQGGRRVIKKVACSYRW